MSKQGFHQYLDRQMKTEEQNSYLAELIAQTHTDHRNLSCRAKYQKIKSETIKKTHLNCFVINWAST